MELKTFEDLKTFVNSLSQSQLYAPLYVVEGQQGLKIKGACTCSQDYINPSGEGIEPRADYLPGGQFAEEPETADVLENEAIVLLKGQPILFIDDVKEL